jgi:hypothetical protein
MITPVLINRIGWKTFLVWMALAFSFVPIIYFFYVETSNISLEGTFSLPFPPDPNVGNSRPGWLAGGGYRERNWSYIG